MHINSLYLWKKQLFENAADVFSGKHEKVVREDEEEIERLKEQLRKKDSLIAGLVEDNIALKRVPMGSVDETLGGPGHLRCGGGPCDVLPREDRPSLKHRLKRYSSKIHHPRSLT